jgi:hypothetical protein
MHAASKVPAAGRNTCGAPTQVATIGRMPIENPKPLHDGKLAFSYTKDRTIPPNWPARVKASPKTLREALRGRVTNHHRFLLHPHLNQIDALDAAMAAIDAQVEANLGLFRARSS